MAKHHPGAYYVNAAQKSGLDVCKGKGDHMIVKGPAGRGYMSVPLHRELATGTECKIRSWFRALGILVVFAILLIIVF